LYFWDVKNGHWLAKFDIFVKYTFISCLQNDSVMKNFPAIFFLLLLSNVLFAVNLGYQHNQTDLRCQPLPLPFLENFDEAIPPALPECWGAITLGHGAKVEVVNFPYNTPPNSVRLEVKAENQSYLILPEFESPSDNLYLSFAARYLGGYTHLSLGIMTDPTDISTFDLKGIIGIATGWNYYLLNIPESEGLTGHIAFKYGAIWDDYPYFGALVLDDIFVNVSEACPAPFRLSVEALNDISAQLVWEPFGSATLWDIEWGLEGFQPGEGNYVEGIAQTFLDLSDLQPETTYQFYVRSRCDSDQTGSWSLPYTFKTYRDDECFYTFILHSTLGNGWNYPALHVIQDGELIAELGQEFETGYTYSVQLSLLNELNFEVHWVEGIYYPARVGLQVFNSFGEIIYDKVPVGWIYEGTTIFSDMALCSASDCPRPTNLSVSSILHNSAIFNWDENGDAAVWQIKYGLQGFSEGEGVFVEQVLEKPFQINGLEPYTVYEFMIRSICSDSLISPWSSRKIFTTQCEPFFLPLTENFDDETPPYLPECWSFLEVGSESWVRTNLFFYNSPPNSVEMRYHYYDTYATLMILPTIKGDVSALSLKFRVLYMSGAQQLDVGVITDPTDESSFTLVESFELIKNWQWNEFRVYFADYTGENGRIAIRYGNIETGNQNVIFIDDVIVEALSTCPAPFELYATHITKDSALLGWNDLGYGETWDVEWGVIPFQSGDGTLVQGIDQNFLELENLTSSTRFQFYVRAHCAEDEISEWSERHKFATSCDVFNAPFQEDFDDLELHEMPLCWIVNGSQDGQYEVGLSLTFYQSPPHSLLMLRQSNNYSMFITPELAHPIHELILRFSARFSYWDANILRIGTIEDPYDTSSFTEFSSYALPQTWTQFEVDLSSYEGTDKHIGFKFGSYDEPGFAISYIDDLEIILPAYMITFYIQDENQQPLEGAEIEIEGQGVLQSDSNGEATYELHNGNYSYNVSADGFEVYNGTFTIESDDQFLIINLIPLSVDDELYWENLVLYPNPFDGMVYIENAAVFRKLSVLNLTGQVVFEKDLHGENVLRLDLSNLLNGFYLVEFYREDRTKVVRKVLKK
jgi:hypothetical protein